ncbi:MAG: RidA family protein [Pseudomonadota bacterium]
MPTVEERLAEHGITLPKPSAPLAAYVPFVQTGNQLFVSGQLPLGLDPVPKGPLTAVDMAEGGTVEPGSTLALAQMAARQCAINLIAQAKAATGDLTRVARVVKLVGFVSSTSEFTQQPIVVNGASELMAVAFGDAGQHARSAVGVAALPLGVVVEVEAIFEVA